ncbi:uncharacterized protein V6R79_004467 [Siganus canaliculatus]
MPGLRQQDVNYDTNEELPGAENVGHQNDFKVMKRESESVLRQWFPWKRARMGRGGTTKTKSVMVPFNPKIVDLAACVDQKHHETKFIWFMLILRHVFDRFFFTNVIRQNPKKAFLASASHSEELSSSI